MGVDLESIKRRIAELNGQRRGGANFVKLDIGEYKLRGIPWKDHDAASPMVERWFYYVGKNPGILTPHQFGKEDPVNDLLRKLYSSGKPDDRLIAKKLQPRMRAYLPCIVRGQEDKGVQVWSMGKMLYQRVLGFFLDEDVGDILNTDDGFDLKLTVTKIVGKDFNDTAVDPARRPSKLSDDPEQVKKWLESTPDPESLYQLKSAREIETILNNWLGSGMDDDNRSSEGTSRGPATPTVSALDDLVDEVKTSSSKPAKNGKSKRSTTSDDVDALLEKSKSPSTTKALDDAFEELMDE